MVIGVKFTSKREKNLWFWALMVLIAIMASLLFGGQLIDFMIQRRLLEHGTFYLFLLLVVAFFLSGWKSKTRHFDYWIYAGVMAVYGMALLRMDLTAAERSHIFEYGLLAILVYEALLERKRNGATVKGPAWIAVFAVGTIGLLDEVVQLLIPYRVFDVVDIGFNYFASAFGVLTSLGVSWLHNTLTKWAKK